MENIRAAKLFWFCVVLMSVVYTVYRSSLEMHIQSKTVLTAMLNKRELSIINRTKLILVTSSQLWGLRFNMGRVGFINAGCEVNNCALTTNHTYIEDYNFDAFVVHGPTQRKGPWILPNRRRHQIFILFSTEPPGESLRLRDLFDDKVLFHIAYVKQPTTAYVKQPTTALSLNLKKVKGLQTRPLNGH